MSELHHTLLSRILAILELLVKDLAYYLTQ